MSLKLKILALASFAIIAGCASQQPAQGPTPETNQAATKPQPAATPAPQAAKPKAEEAKGEVIGTPAPQSKFSKLRIGMSRREVSNLIGVADDELRHETGKRWIPFYFGPDVQRVQVLYKGEGCLSFTGGNQFGAGGRTLIRIHVDPKHACFAG